MWYRNYKTFASTSWNEFKPEETVAYKAINDRWNQRHIEWYPPTDWLDYSSARTFSSSWPISSRYFMLLYYSSINLGTGELSPRNSVETFWFALSLVVSSLMFTIFFSNITALILELKFEAITKQKILDQSNDVMKAIELSFEELSKVRLYQKSIESSQKF